MDSNVHDNTPMEEAVTEEPTSAASGGSKSQAIPEATTTPSTPVSKQAGDESGFVTPRRKRRKEKIPAEKSADASLPKPNQKGATDPSLILKPPFYNRPTGDNPNCVHLWNAGGKRSNKRAPKEHAPKIVVVDQTPIYVQTLTAAQAEACGVYGWDSVLADIAVMLPDTVENRIVSFWADWKRKLRKLKTDAAAQRQRTRAEAKSKTTPPNSSASPGAGEKRKCGATPLSSEPAGKSSKQYAEIAAKRSSQRAKKDHEEILYVHSTEEEKGPVSESIFFYVISWINKIKIDAINDDDESHTWPPAIKGQPIYDHVNRRGKIMCVQTNKLLTSGSSISIWYPQWSAKSNSKRGTVRSMRAKMRSTPV